MDIDVDKYTLFFFFFNTNTKQYQVPKFNTGLHGQSPSISIGHSILVQFLFSEYQASTLCSWVIKAWVLLNSHFTRHLPELVV